MTVKSGFKTSEFVAAALASISSWLFSWQGSLSPRYAAIATTVATAAFILSRGITKHGVATAHARVVPVAGTGPTPLQTPPVVTPPTQV